MRRLHWPYVDNSCPGLRELPSLFFLFCHASLTRLGLPGSRSFFSCNLPLDKLQAPDIHTHLGHFGFSRQHARVRPLPDRLEPALVIGHTPLAA